MTWSPGPKHRPGCPPTRGGSWHEGLELVCSSLSQPSVSTGGRAQLAGEAVNYLANRLRVDAHHRTHPDLASTEVTAPVVILGLPRTGTTVLSYLFGCDPRWRTLRNWEAVQSVPPPTTATLTTDPRCREMLELQEAILPRLDPPPPHWEWADGPTECTFLLAQDFRAAMWDSRVPNPDYHRWIAECDMTPAYAHHRRTLQVLQSEAPGRWVLKMPAHALFIDALLATYPDARIIWTHRDPYKSVASFCDLTGFSHGLSLGAPDREWIRERVAAPPRPVRRAGRADVGRTRRPPRALRRRPSRPHRRDGRPLRLARRPAHRRRAHRHAGLAPRTTRSAAPVRRRTDSPSGASSDPTSSRGSPTTPSATPSSRSPSTDRRPRKCVLAVVLGVGGPRTTARTTLGGLVTSGPSRTGGEIGAP